MKSKTLKIKNKPQEPLSFFRMNIKPTEALSMVLLCSVIFLFLDAPFPTLGLILCTVVCFALVATPDRTLLEMNDEFITFYSPKDSTECSILYWDEILTWQYVKHRDCDHLKIEMINGELHDSEVYYSNRLLKLLDAYAHGKEKKVVRKRRNA